MNDVTQVGGKHFSDTGYKDVITLKSRLWVTEGKKIPNLRDVIFE